MKEKNKQIILYLLEILSVMYIHYNIFINMNGIAICDADGRMLVLTVTDYLLFFSLVIGNVWKLYFILSSKKVKGSVLISVLSYWELFMCCIYLHNPIVACSVIMYIIIDIKLHVSMKRKVKGAVELPDLGLRKNKSNKIIISGLILAIITVDIASILSDPEVAYFYTNSDWNWQTIEFQNSENLEECDEYLYVFRHYFLLGEFARSTGKKYRISNNEIDTATVQIGTGHEQVTDFDEIIVCNITAAHRFTGLLSYNYIIKVYAFQVALLELCVMSIILLWVLERKSSRKADNEQ